MRTKKAQPLFSFAVLTLLTSLMGCTSIPSILSKESLLTSQVFTIKLHQGRYGHAIVNNGEHIFFLEGSGKHGLLSNLEIINSQTGTIEQVNNLLIHHLYHTTVRDGRDSIYIVGGMSAFTYGKKRRLLREPEMEVFDIPSRQSKIIGQIPGASRLGSAQYHNDKIFFIGGSRQNSTPSTVGIYDVTKDKWQLTEKIPTPKDTKTIQRGQYLFTIEGYNGKSPLNAFERYNIFTGKWQSLASIPQKLSAHSVVVFDNRIPSFGDYTRLDNTLIYDFKTEAWHQTTIGYLPNRHNLATVLNNRIYVIEGNTDGSGSSRHYSSIRTGNTYELA
jgi:N-acetylneuraminic acid mutarotase